MLSGFFTAFSIRNECRELWIGRNRSEKSRTVFSFAGPHARIGPGIGQIGQQIDPDKQEGT